MKITLFSEYYEPLRGGHRRIGATARKFASSGFAVDVVTGVSAVPDWLGDRKRRALLAVDRDGSIRVTRVWACSTPARAGMLQALNWLVSALGAAIVAMWRIRSGDAIYVSMPSASVAFPALVASLFSGAPLFVDVRCGEPQPPQGRLGEFAAAITAMTYRRARTIFCATSALRDAILRRVPNADVVIVTDGYDRVPAAGSCFERTSSEFVAAYAGGMNGGCGLEPVIEAAALLREEPGIRFVLVGDGTAARALRDRTREQALNNVEFFGAVPPAIALGAIASADIAVVPDRRREDGRMPSKLFDALGSGCPVLCAGDGDASALVERAGGGWNVPADARAIARAILAARDDATERRARGRAGRAYVQEHYDRDRIVGGVVRSVYAAASPMLHRARERTA